MAPVVRSRTITEDATARRGFLYPASRTFRESPRRWAGKEHAGQTEPYRQTAQHAHIQSEVLK